MVDTAAGIVVPKPSVMSVTQNDLLRSHGGVVVAVAFAAHAGDGVVHRLSSEVKLSFMSMTGDACAALFWTV